MSFDARVVCSLVLLYAICRVVPRCAALLCCCVTNAYIVVCQIRASSVCIVFALCVYVLFVCMHGDHFFALYCAHTVLQVRRFVSRVAFGDHRAHDNVRVTLFSPFVAFANPLHSLLWIYFF